MSLPDFIGQARWAVRSEFPPSSLLGGRVFTCGDGWYLMTNPRRGLGDPVHSVGWAQSDYWARRSWEVPPFAGGLVPPQPQRLEVPSLRALGRPDVLAFEKVREFESRQPGAKTVTMVDARYRLTDGAFLFCAIHGCGGVTYIYASNEPGSSDQPVALQFQLPVPAS